MRAAVGRPERSARRAALVPEQDPEHRRRARAAAASQTREDTIRLDLADCFVDAIEIARATEEGIDDARAGAAAGAGHAVRRRLPGRAGNRPQSRPSTAGSPPSGGDSAAATPPCWSISPGALPTTRRSATWRSGCSLRRSIRRVHEILLAALARHGRIREGEEHLAATARLFEAEGLDCAPIRDAWRSAEGAAHAGRAGDRGRGAAAAVGTPPPAAAATASPAAAAAPRLHRGDAVRRPVRRRAAPAAGPPTRSPTT